MSILLVHPSREVIGKKDLLYRPELLTPSLSLAAIAAYCRENNISSQIIDLRLPHRTIEDVVDDIKKHKRLLVVISAFTAEIVSAGRLALLIKGKFPEMKISIGGPHATSLPRETLKEFPGFDFAVVGEGEKTLVELTNALDSHNQNSFLDIKGIALRQGDEIVLLPPRPEIKDLDALPYPAWDLFELQEYSSFFMINASRGCFYRCCFCNPDYLGKPRFRKAAKVVDEIEYLLEKFGATTIQFVDATLGSSREFAISLCDELIRRKLNGTIQWICETRADRVDKTLLEKMKKAGCQLISLGVESGNEMILSEVIHKGESKEDIAGAVREIKGAGIRVRGFFNFGYPGETQLEMRETVNFALELNPDIVTFGLLVPYPGTELRDMAKKGMKGARLLHERWDEYNQLEFSCYETEDVPLKELKRWQAKAYFSFYLHHPFKALDLLSQTWGYTGIAILKIFSKLWSQLTRK